MWDLATCANGEPNVVPVAFKDVTPDGKLVFWCNPQNPSGRMWTEHELKKAAEIMQKYILWVVSDEIHCDLIRCGNRHIPMAKVMTDAIEKHNSK